MSNFTVLHHEDGQETTVTTDENGSRMTGYYGGDGGIHNIGQSHDAAVDEARQSASNHGNPVVSTSHGKPET